jgi:hypothetical protein
MKSMEEHRASLDAGRKLDEFSGQLGLPHMKPLNERSRGALRELHPPVPALSTPYRSTDFVRLLATVSKTRYGKLCSQLEHLLRIPHQ